MNKAVKRILKDTCDMFYDYRLSVLDFNDPEDVHRMRVKGRTLLAYFSVLVDKKEASRPGFLKMKRPLKKAMRILGELRDMDVLVDEMEARSATMMPGQMALIDGWLNQVRVERARLRERLAMELPGIIGPRWKNRMRRWIREATPRLADTPAIEAKVARLRKKKERAMKAIGAYPTPDIADPEFLDLVHEGRIAVKKLRYALNILKKQSSANKAEIDALKALQDKLGHVQDLRVWAGRLQGHYMDNPLVGEITADWRREMLESIESAGLRGD